MQHKWHKEIKAWADGAEIESKVTYIGDENDHEWYLDRFPNWYSNEYKFRIKPQPKEPQYLYIYGMGMGMELTLKQLEDRTLIGKIKLEEV